MADAHRHLDALAQGAADGRRSFERRIAAADAGWDDPVRRAFEAEHLAALRADARRLADDLAALAGTADAALRALD